jgi:hypothetical protein
MTKQDETEAMRRALIASGQPQRDLEKAAERWSTAELVKEFEVHSFSAPFVVVTRRSDGVIGSMEFVHEPRVYFNFVPHK